MTAPPLTGDDSPFQVPLQAVLELADGSAFRGTSFGAEGKSVSGECVFQTGEHCTFVWELGLEQLVIQGWWDILSPSQTLLTKDKY